MQVVILRGSNQIGGNLVSVSCENTTILLDAGEELERDSGIPPQAKALTRPGGFDAVFVTHYHREYSATSNGLKYKQLGAKYGKIGAREMGETAEKACTKGGGADV